MMGQKDSGGVVGSLTIRSPFPEVVSVTVTGRSSTIQLHTVGEAMEHFAFQHEIALHHNI